MARLNQPLDDDLHARAKSAAALTGRRLYQLVEDAIRAEVERVEAERAEAERRRRGR